MILEWESCIFRFNIALVAINFCLLLCIILQASFSRDCEVVFEADNRIINSTLTTIQTYPFVAAFVLGLSSDIKFICASTIISKSWVLTADHCLETGEGFGITDTRIISNHFGLKKGIQHQVKKYIRSHRRKLDLGLVQVVEPFEARFEKLIPVAKRGYKFIPDKIVTVIGWGLTPSSFLLEPNALHRTELRLYKYQECVNVMNTLRKSYSDLPHLDESKICAGPHNNLTGYQDVCNFDSGSPIVDDDLLIGVVSWTPAEAKTSLNCEQNYPGIYVRLWICSEWIQQIEKKEKQKIAIFMKTPSWSRPILPD